MPSGGKRKGAGRKPKLDSMSCLRAGAHCERLWREAYEGNLAAAIDDATWIVQDEHNELKQIPIEERAAFIKSEKGQTYVDAVRDALRVDQGISDDSEPSRLVHIQAKRPKGIRSEIISKVAEAEGTTDRMVETCWKEFRQLQKEERS